MPGDPNVVPDGGAWWATLLAGVGTGAAAVLAVFFGEAKAIVADLMARLRRRLRPHQEYARQIAMVGRFMTAVEASRAVAAIDRVMVMRGHNCGGPPQPGKPYYVRALYGWARPPHPDPLARYDFELGIDLPYATVLTDMLRDGISVQTTAKMPPSRLRSFYSHEGVVQSRIYLLALLDNELVYVSFANYSREFTEPECSEIDLCAEQLRAALIEGAASS